MLVLKIKMFDDEKDLATVYSNLDGTFKVKADLPEDEKYFTDLINQIAKDNPTLTLRDGKMEETDGQIIESTVVSTIPNNDIRYLSALWDYFNKGKDTYKGKPFRTYSKYEVSADTLKIISQVLFNLYLNVSGFPKLKPEYYKDPFILGSYFITGPDLTSGKSSITDIVKARMKEDNIEYDPKLHIFISIPQESKSVGAPCVVVVKLPQKIQEDII